MPLFFNFQLRYCSICRICLKVKAIRSDLLSKCKCCVGLSEPTSHRMTETSCGMVCLRISPENVAKALLCQTLGCFMLHSYAIATKGKICCMFVRNVHMDGIRLLCMLCMYTSGRAKSTSIEHRASSYYQCSILKPSCLFSCRIYIGRIAPSLQ